MAKNFETSKKGPSTLMVAHEGLGRAYQETLDKLNLLHESLKKIAEAKGIPYEMKMPPEFTDIAKMEKILKDSVRAARQEPFPTPAVKKLTITFNVEGDNETVAVTEKDIEYVKYAMYSHNHADDYWETFIDNLSGLIMGEIPAAAKILDYYKITYDLTKRGMGKGTFYAAMELITEQQILDYYQKEFIDNEEVSLLEFSKDLFEISCQGCWVSL